MSLRSWLLFCLTEAVLCLKPGPATLVVVSTGLGGGLRTGLWAALGVLSANIVYFALAGLGLLAVYAAAPEWFVLVRWAGAGYLLVLGAAMIRGGRNRESRAPAPTRSRGGRAYVRGLIVQGANPLLLIYFTAILPQFIDARAAPGPQVAILALTSVAIEFVVLAGYALLGAQAAGNARAGMQPYLDVVGGGLLIAAAVGLARVGGG